MNNVSDTFSIIVPAYNEEKYISRCLQSIFALKDQAIISEVIVVNNASTDGTAEVVKRDFPAAIIIDEARKGLTIAYNRGAKDARGNILVFVDADMVLNANHLIKVAQEFIQDPTLIALSGPYVYQDGSPFCKVIMNLTYMFLAVPAEMLFNRVFNISASIASGNSAVRKKAFDQVGGFNEAMFYGLETDFALRLKRFGKVRFKPGLSAMSSSRRLAEEGTLKVVFLHVMNTLWPLLFHRPFTLKYADIR